MNEESLGHYFDKVLGFLKQPFLQMGNFSISLFSFLYVAIFFALLSFGASYLHKFIVKRLNKNRPYNASIETIASLIHYGLLAIGIMVILQSAGLDLSGLGVLAGAVGIGLGLGLQNIANNFISGIIILFERPIKVGDRVEIKEIAGQVTRIGMRASTVLTNDNIAIIIPNSDFISAPVINWSHTDETVRLRIPIGVSYKEDLHQVLDVLRGVIASVEGIAKNRNSDVIIDSFSDSQIKLVMRIWTRDYAKRPGLIKHEVYVALWDALKKHDIEIPFPQLDLHVIKDDKPQTS